MARQLSAAHKRAMAQGRERARREEQKDSKKRVVTYRRWLANGSVLKEIPEIPSDSDFARLRSAEAIRGRPYC